MAQPLKVETIQKKQLKKLLNHVNPKTNENHYLQRILQHVFLLSFPLVFFSWLPSLHSLFPSPGTAPWLSNVPH